MDAHPLPKPRLIRRLRLRMRWYSWLLLAGVICYGVASLMHWDDRGALWVQEGFVSTAERSSSIWLPLSLIHI